MINLNLKKPQFILLFGIFAIIFSCTSHDLKFEEESKLKVEKVLNSAENTIKVMGQYSSGVDLKNENFDSLSADIVKSLSSSSYESRKAYLFSEECLRKKRLNIDRTIERSNNSDWLKQVQDSVYHSFLRQAVIQIDSIANLRNSEPTIQDILIEIEKLNALKVELENMCE